MKNLVEDFTSVQWWIGVVIVGILINLLSAYLKKWLDEYRSSISSKWKKKSEINKQKQELIIQNLIQNPSELLFLALREVRTRIRSVSFSVSAILLLGLGQLVDEKIFQIIMFSSASISVLTGLSDLNEAIRTQKLIDDVRMRIKT